ncbi:hypothetical protein [Cupriavidus taiwanensis]|uniref:hypothetical protein n=1 Tax=Cupriavidus taiwanensis TaxID=164546 RepID=UPI000E10E34C|nr:hypothetical protein [Cupriavidus taiwanensis]SPA50589.1 protein of unknown function [Cupriavidus taiwanensis]
MYEIYDDPWYVQFIRCVLRLAVIGAAVYGLVRLFAWVDSRPGVVAAREAQARQEAANRVPDGCTVYTFYNGDRWQFFTKCPSASTTTLNTHTESCGKTCSRTVESPITN